MKKLIGLLVILVAMTSQASASKAALICHDGLGAGFRLEFTGDSDPNHQAVKIVESSGLSPIFIGLILGLQSYNQSTVITKSVYANDQINLLYMTRKIFHHDNCGRGGCFDLPPDQILRIVQITTVENKQFNFQCSKN